VPLLQRQFLYNPLQLWLTGAVTAAIVFVIALIVRRLLVSRLGVLAARTTNQFDDMVVDLIRETRTWVLFVVALFAGFAQLTMSARAATYFQAAAKLVVLWQAAVWGAAAVGFWVKYYLERRTASHDRASIAKITAMGVGAKVVLWIMIGLTALQTVFGLAVAPLITGLGVGGIALALAVQNVLGDILAALAIVFDKPFDVGDSIGVDSISGTVEHIGLKTTRIRSASGEQVIVGNADLLKSRLRNFRRMSQRRVAFNLDVTFDTPPDVLARIPMIVEGIVTAQKPVQFDRSHVASFGESFIRIETVYFVLDPDYRKFMDIQQAVNIEILRRFASEKISFAFPSRTVYHEGPLARDVIVTEPPPHDDNSSSVTSG
jgi:small-conductance mechanosensitive channel